MSDELLADRRAEAELIDRTPPGEPVVIIRDDRPVAQLVPLPIALPEPVFGSCKGKLTIVSDDDDNLTDFAEYMA